MTTEDKPTLSQMIESVKESIRLKWVELHAHLATPQQRKALRAEIRDAVSGMGKTIKQFDPRGSKPKKAPAKKKAKAKTTSTKKKSKAKKKK